MNRTERRRLMQTVKRSLKPGSLKHPVPDSVTLVGGPMNGWIVTPDAPALDADWRAKYIEIEAAKLYLEECAARGLTEAPLWSGIPDELREPFRQAAKQIHGGGRYVRGAGREARWEEDTSNEM